jgi:bile acid:Na+ symporter, BASS family
VAAHDRQTVLDLLMRVSVLLFMIGSLAGIGLRVSAGDALGPLSEWRFLAVSLVTSWLICPLVAVGVLHYVPLAPPYAAGLILLSLAPCAPFAPAVVRVGGGDPSALAAFMVFSAVTTVLFMPVGVSLLIEGAAISPWRIARPLLLFVLVPLACGMGIRYLRPSMAERLQRPLEMLTAAAGLLLLVIIVLRYGAGILDAYGSHAVLAQVVFLLIVTPVTHGLGRMLRPAQQTVVTLGIATRNLGAALAPISAVAADERGVVMIAIGGVATLLWSLFVARRLARRAEQAAGVTV